MELLLCTRMTFHRPSQYILMEDTADVLNGYEQPSENLTYEQLSQTEPADLLGRCTFPAARRACKMSIHAKRLAFMYFFCQSKCVFVNVPGFMFCSLYKGLNEALFDPGKHWNQTKSHLQGYISASPASSTMNSGQHSTFNRHDLTAQGWVSLCVCFLLRLHIPVLLVCLSVLPRFLCQCNPLRLRSDISLLYVHTNAWRKSFVCSVVFTT